MASWPPGSGLRSHSDTGPSRIPTKCIWGDNCRRRDCEFAHPHNSNYAMAATAPPRHKQGPGRSPPRERDRGYTGRAGDRGTPPPPSASSTGGDSFAGKRGRRGSDEDEWSREHREKRQRTTESDAGVGWGEPRPAGWAPSRVSPNKPGDVLANHVFGKDVTASPLTSAHALPIQTPTPPGITPPVSRPTSSANGPIGAPSTLSASAAHPLQPVAPRDPRLRPNGPPPTGPNLSRVKSPVLSSSAAPTSIPLPPPPNPNQFFSPAANTLPLVSPWPSVAGVNGQVDDMQGWAGGGNGIAIDPAAKQGIILVPEAGNIPLDQMKSVPDVMGFVMRRMSSALRANVTREDLVAKHVVLKSLRSTVVAPLSGVGGSSTPNAQVEATLDASRRDIHKVEQKLARYQAETEAGWKQLATAIALGHLPGLAEVRDVEGVRIWIDGLKAQMARDLVERLREEMARAEQRVVQAAAAARPKDEVTERRLGELTKAVEDMRLEQARDKRSGADAFQARLEVLERGLTDRQRAEKESQGRIDVLTRRIGDLEGAFAFTREELDEHIVKFGALSQKVDSFSSVEQELRAILESSVSSQPDPSAITNSILDRLTPRISELLQKHITRYQTEMKDFRTKLDERLSHHLGEARPPGRLLGEVDRAGKLLNGVLDPAGAAGRSLSLGARHSA